MIKLRSLAALVLFSLASFTLPAVSAETTTPAAELDALVARVQTKLREGKKTEAELAPELKEFDLLLAKYKGLRSEAVANILVQEASLYLKVLENYDKATRAIETLKRDFPQTKAGKEADELLASITRHAEAKRLQAILVVGSRLPDFDVQDLARKPLSLAQYKGKLVLLDFGATWSQPWMAEAPNLHRLYQRYHADGFEVIGVNMDEDLLKLSGFNAKHQVPWRQYADASKWKNKLAVKYGVNSLPANFLLDGEGKILARNLRGEALNEAVAASLTGRIPKL
jgi:peroxiredoxin